MFRILIPAVILGWLFVEKNVLFFEEQTGSALNIISHGLGMLLDPIPVVGQCVANDLGGVICIGAITASGLGPIVSGVFLFLLFAVGVVVFHFLSLPTLAVRGVVLSLLMGIFGITTLFSIIFVLPIILSRGRCKDCFR